MTPPADNVINFCLRWRPLTQLPYLVAVRGPKRLIQVPPGDCRSGCIRERQFWEGYQSVFGRLTNRLAVGLKNHPPPALVPPSAGTLWPVT
jgi:hypothetical protein